MTGRTAGPPAVTTAANKAVLPLVIAVFNALIFGLDIPVLLNVCIPLLLLKVIVPVSAMEKTVLVFTAGSGEPVILIVKLTPLLTLIILPNKGRPVMSTL